MKETGSRLHGRPCSRGPSLVRFWTVAHNETPGCVWEHRLTAHLAWKVGIHLTFVFSGVMFAITDRIAEGKPGGR